MIKRTQYILNFAKDFGSLKRSNFCSDLLNTQVTLMKNELEYFKMFYHICYKL